MTLRRGDQQEQQLPCLPSCQPGLQMMCWRAGLGNVWLSTHSYKAPKTPSRNQMCLSPPDSVFSKPEPPVPWKYLRLLASADTYTLHILILHQQV